MNINLKITLLIKSSLTVLTVFWSVEEEALCVGSSSVVLRVEEVVFELITDLMIDAENSAEARDLRFIVPEDGQPAIKLETNKEKKKE